MREMSLKTRERKIRRTLERHGCRLVKTRRPDIRGGKQYMVVDVKTGYVLTHEAPEGMVTLKQVEKLIHETLDKGDRSLHHWWDSSIPKTIIGGRRSGLTDEEMSGILDIPIEALNLIMEVYDRKNKKEE